MRKLNYLVVHHSAVVQPDIKKLIASISRSHKTRLKQRPDTKGSFIAYHYIIGVDGTIVQTRLPESVGRHASNKKVNDTSIGVCLSGDLDKHEATKEQYMSLIELVNKYKLPIRYHREFAKKSCPGNKFDYNFISNYNKKIMSKFKSIFEKEVKDPIFNKHEGDSPLTEQDVKYLLEIAISRSREKIIKEIKTILKL